MTGAPHIVCPVFNPELKSLFKIPENFYSKRTSTNVMFICISAAVAQTTINNPLDQKNISVNPIKYVSAETMAAASSLPTPRRFIEI